MKDGGSFALAKSDDALSNADGDGVGGALKCVPVASIGGKAAGVVRAGGI